MSTIYLFTRDVTGDAGEPLTQTVTVCASDVESAYAVVQRDFDGLRAASANEERPYKDAHKGWKIYEVPLSGEGVINCVTNQRVI